MWHRRSSMVNKQTQTAIQSNCQRDVTQKSAGDNNSFYALLEYTPFQRIKGKSTRVINLPETAHLYYHSISISRLWLQNCLCVDDDALSEICLELRDRIRQGLFRKLKTFNDSETQTNLHVQPHILSDEGVAKVLLEREVQTE